MIKYTKKLKLFHRKVNNSREGSTKLTQSIVKRRKSKSNYTTNKIHLQDLIVSFSSVYQQSNKSWSRKWINQSTQQTGRKKNTFEEQYCTTKPWRKTHQKIRKSWKVVTVNWKRWVHFTKQPKNPKSEASGRQISDVLERTRQREKPFASSCWKIILFLGIFYSFTVKKEEPRMCCHVYTKSKDRRPRMVGIKFVDEMAGRDTICLLNSIGPRFLRALTDGHVFWTKNGPSVNWATDI